LEDKDDEEVIISLFCIQGSFDKMLGSFFPLFFGGGGRAAKNWRRGRVQGGKNS